MKIKFFYLIPILALALSATACGGSSTETDPQLKEEIIELETTTEELDSTMVEINEIENDLDAALEDLDLGE